MKYLGGKWVPTRYTEIGLTFIAIFLWVLSILQARINVSNIGDLGLITILPLTYFVSFSLLTMSFIITLTFDRENITLLIVQVFSLILFLHLTPALIEGNPRFGPTYSTYAAVDYVVKEGHTNPSISFLWYQNWPAFSFIFSFFSMITSFPVQTFLMIYPTVYSIMLFPVLCLFFREVNCRDEKMWLAIWVFYVADWIGQNYFSLQSLGFFSYALIMCFIVGKNIDKLADNKIQYLVILTLLLSALVTTHFLSYVAVLTVLFGFFILKYFRRMNFITFSVVLLVSWLMTGAVFYVQGNLRRFVSEALDLELIFTRNVTERVSGSVGHVFVSQSRIIFTGAMLVFAFFGLILMLRRRKIGDTEKRVLFVVPSFMMLLLLFVYGGELLMRLYLFSLLPLAYFVSQNLISKKTFIFLSLFLIIFVPLLNVVAHYGNETVDYVRPSELSGTKFFFQMTRGGDIIGFFIRGNFLYYPGYNFIPLRATEWKDNVLLPQTITMNQTAPVFLTINTGAIKAYDSLGTRSTYINSSVQELHISLEYSAHYNKIYSAPDFDLFKLTYVP